MMKARLIQKPETAVKTMLLEDRADAMAYIKEQLTLNALRTATQNLQAVCNIVYQILDQDNPNILDAYKVANFVATAYHDDIDIFKEIERASIESHKGNLFVPAYVNLNDAYISDKFTGAKSGYLVEGIANMLSILNLTAHILSREILTKKSIIIANDLVLQARYEFGRDIVSNTNMKPIWNRVVNVAPDTIVGKSNPFITMGETRSIHGHKIFFTPNGIFVDDENPIAKRTVSHANRTYCALYFMNIDAWLYFHKSGEYGFQKPDGGPCYDTGYLAAPKCVSESMYREIAV
jgi:hypothetical protein